MAQIAFRREVELFISEALSPQARSAHLAQGARQILADMIASGEGSRHHQRIVDGVSGALEDSVRPEGLIVYRFSHWATVCQFAISFLTARSPERSGRYRESFFFGFFTAEGQDRARFVPWRDVVPTAITADVTKVMIGNFQPYGRKVDVQVVGRETIKFSVAPGIFDDAARQINSRFAGIVSARRQYNVDLGARRYIAKRGTRAGKAVESPALIITQER
ncbi:hypothetical protein [Niveispirillum cyanobacteriorum]|uniref:Uncharacterized protein n=1 Tax=Niveispirillum cyanobacteriorum TaxID=1612173 RepID=A0A2K9NFS1_9PROT|nr:hypothetical protein [Niveispirillum cyanobacteriorum]AUN31939.1 hypothetical protein C0V82_16030 [Niveispirillum cyanobacteriorum]GGE85605.1 hypothetical protein GCM10011317_48500 [Niveispirillum cyanobacteriorum]